MLFTLRIVVRKTNVAMQEYNGFNLVVGDISTKEIAYLTNRDQDGPLKLVPGTYGISNGTLNSAWPKVFRGKDALQVSSCLGLPRLKIQRHPCLAQATSQWLVIPGISIADESVLASKQQDF